MDIGKYKQAMSYLLNQNATLKTFVINPEAKLIDNDPPSLVETFAKGGVVDGGSVERQGFSTAGLVSISNFSRQQKSIGQQAFQKYLIPSQINTKGGKDLLNALSEAGIVFSDKKGPSGERYLKNVNKNTIKNFEKNIKNIREYVEVPAIVIKNNVGIGVRWPNKDIEKEYIDQIKERSKYSKNSNELQEKIKSGEILSDSQLAKKFNMNYSEVVRINSQIKKDYDLERPVIGRDETKKQVDIKRKEAQLKFSDAGFEKKYSGTYKAHLGHMGDLYNRIVTSKNLGYTPAEINDAMKETLDPILKNISQAQDKLIKNKPPGWKQKLEEYNKKGINYSSLAEGYKSFDIIDPNTLKKYTYGVDYLKTIDPAALYEGKPIKEVAELTDKREINKIQKAFDDLTEAKKIARTEGLEQADISKIKNSELLTEENLRKLQNYKAFEKNRETILKSQSNIKPLLKKQIIESIGNNINELPSDKKAEIVSIAGGCSPKYADGGRVKFSEGGDCYIKGLKNLEEGNLGEKEINAIGQSLKEDGMLSKQFETSIDAFKTLARGGKNLLQGFDELMIFGRSPLGRAAGYGLGVALPAYFAGEEALKGNYKQAGRELLNIPTLGFGLPESWVGSNKTDLINHAKEKGLDVDAVERFFNKSEISKKINDAEELLNMGSTNEKFIKSVEDRKKSLYDEYNNIKLSPADIKNFNTTLKSFTEENYGKTLLSEEMQKNKTARDVNKYYTENLDPDFISENKIKISPNTIEPYQEDLPDYYKLSAADGGRVKLADGGGPKFTRRGALGLLGALAATPLVKSLMKGEKLAGEAKLLKTANLIPKAKGMPEWFPSLVARIEKEGKYVGKDTGLVDNLRIKELTIQSKTEKGASEVYTMIQHPNGDITIEANVKGGAFDGPFELHYSPPKTDMNVETGQPITYPGEFHVMENRPISTARSHHDADFELDYQLVSPEEAISDIERVEKVATGRRIHPKRVEERTAARKYIEENPYEDIINRYGEVDVGDWWEQ
jgi:hypothetical protein